MSHSTESLSEAPVDHSVHGDPICHFGAILPLSIGSNFSYKNVEVFLVQARRQGQQGVAWGGFGISQQLRGHKEAPGPAPGTGPVPTYPINGGPGSHRQGVRGRKTQRLQGVNKLN